MVISLAPSIAGFSDYFYNAAWSDWAAEGLFDEIVPQAYRADYASFASIWPAQVRAADGAAVLAAGLRTRGSGPATPWEELRPMIERARLDGAGQSFWYSEGLTGFPGHLDELSAFYNVATNGQAPHPLFVPEPGALSAMALGALLVRRRR